MCASVRAKYITFIYIFVHSLLQSNRKSSHTIPFCVENDEYDRKDCGVDITSHTLHACNTAILYRFNERGYCIAICFWITATRPKRIKKSLHRNERNSDNDRSSSSGKNGHKHLSTYMSLGLCQCLCISASRSFPRSLCLRLFVCLCVSAS